MSDGRLHAAPHVQATQSPAIVRVSAMAAEEVARGRDVISLGQATCNVAPPIDDDALHAFLHQDALTQYSPDAGLPELRRAVADDLRARRGVEVDAEREVLITAGANHAFHSALHTILSPCDTVALFTPMYFNHEMAVTLLGGVAREMACGDDLLPDVDALAEAVTDRTRAVVLVSPSNPTGRVIPQDLLKRILDFAAARGVWVIVDETYEGIVYEGAESYTAAQYLADTPNLIVLSSYSKRLGIAGCRVGTLLCRADLMEQVMKVQDTTVICAARPSQLIAAHCLPKLGAHLDDIIAAMTPRRALIAERLPDALAPDGAFFFFMNIAHTGATSWEFVERAIREVGVVTVPGACCGEGWENWVRLSFGSVAPARLEEAVARLVGMMRDE